MKKKDNKIFLKDTTDWGTRLFGFVLLVLGLILLWLFFEFLLRVDLIPAFCVSILGLPVGAFGGGLAFSHETQVIDNTEMTYTSKFRILFWKRTTVYNLDKKSYIKINSKRIVFRTESFILHTVYIVTSDDEHSIDASRDSDVAYQLAEGLSVFLNFKIKDLE